MIHALITAKLHHTHHTHAHTHTHTHLIAEHGQQARELEMQHLRRQTQQQLDDGECDRRAHHLERLVLHQVLVQLQTRNKGNAKEGIR